MARDNICSRNEELVKEAIEVLKMLGIYKDDLTIEFRKYSKSYYGRYYVNEKKIVAYALDEWGRLIPPNQLMYTIIHETIHHLEIHYYNKYVAVKGVMHSAYFKKLQTKYYDLWFKVCKEAPLNYR